MPTKQSSGGVSWQQEWGPPGPAKPQKTDIKCLRPAMCLVAKGAGEQKILCEVRGRLQSPRPPSLLTPIASLRVPKTTRKFHDLLEGLIELAGSCASQGDSLLKTKDTSYNQPRQEVRRAEPRKVPNTVLPVDLSLWICEGLTPPPCPPPPLPPSMYNNVHRVLPTRRLTQALLSRALLSRVSSVGTG